MCWVAALGAGLSAPGYAPDVGFDAVILAGGAGSRLGGRDKAELDLGAGRLLDLALAAVEAADRKIVVGPPRSPLAGVESAREDPVGSGPVAALAAALRKVSAPVTMVLAVDLPRIGPEPIRKLVSALADTDADAAVAIDAGGRVQPLLAAYRTEALRAAMTRLGDTTNASMSALISGLTTAKVSEPDAARDIDTLEDLRAFGGDDAR